MKAIQSIQLSRAMHLARLWGVALDDALLAVTCESALKAMLAQCGIAPYILDRIRLVKIGDNFCLDERPLNDLPTTELHSVREKMRRLMGINL